MKHQQELQQILEILKDASFGDLAFLDHGRPAVVEPACRSTMRYACVIADGEISELTAPAEKAAALDLIMNHYGAAGHFDYPAPMLERTAILKLTVASVSGKSNCR